MRSHQDQVGALLPRRRQDFARRRSAPLQGLNRHALQQRRQGALQGGEIQRRAFGMDGMQQQDPRPRAAGQAGGPARGRGRRRIGGDRQQDGLNRARLRIAALFLLRNLVGVIPQVSQQRPTRHPGQAGSATKPVIPAKRREPREPGTHHANGEMGPGSRAASRRWPG
jgi:hypothetical protein